MFMLLDSIWLREVYLPHKKNVEDVYIWTTHTFKSSQRHEELELCHAGDAIVALNSLELYLEEKKTLIKLFRFDENETDQDIYGADRGVSQKAEKAFANVIFTNYADLYKRSPKQNLMELEINAKMTESEQRDLKDIQIHFI